MVFPSRSFPLILILAFLFIVIPVSAVIDPCPMGAQEELNQLYTNAAQSRGGDGSCDAHCEQQYILLERTSCEYAAVGYCYEWNPAVCSKYGTSRVVEPEPTPNGHPPDDGTWILVIGAIVVIGGGLIIIAKKLGGSKDR